MFHAPQLIIICVEGFLFSYSGGSERDAQDISYVLTRYWNRVDINRITEQDMNVFVTRNTSAAPAWAALRRKYGM